MIYRLDQTMKVMKTLLYFAKDSNCLFINNLFWHFHSLLHLRRGFASSFPCHSNSALCNVYPASLDRTKTEITINMTMTRKTWSFLQKICTQQQNGKLLSKCMILHWYITYLQNKVGVVNFAKAHRPKTLPIRWLL